MELFSRIGYIIETMKKPHAILISLIVSLPLGALLYYTTNYSLAMVNMGIEYAIAIFILQWLIGFFAGINAALIYERYINLKEVLGAKRTTFATAMSVLVSGCPVCGVTFASSIGIAPLLGALPFYGLELKALSLAVMLFALYQLAGPPSCKPSARRR